MPDPTFNPGTASGANDILQAEAMRRVLQLALFSGTAGVGARALQGIGDFVGRAAGRDPKPAARPLALPIPVPVTLPRRRKSAQAADEPGPLGRLARYITTQVPWMHQPGTLSGWQNPNMADKSWVYPAGAAAAAGGLYGGYKLTDFILDRTKKREQESELERARRDYQEALMGQYPPKAASAGDALDALYEASREKRANLVTRTLAGLPETVAGELPPWLVGTALTGMGTLAVGSGLASYNWARDHSQTKALEEAIRRRQEQLAAQSPPSLMAVPVPHPRGRHPELPDEDDELAKEGSLATAADGVLQRLQSRRQQAMQQWRELINGPDKSREQAKPQPPQAPQLPSLAGLISGQRPQPQPAAQ
jgi:hypothetical protein